MLRRYFTVLTLEKRVVLTSSAVSFVVVVNKTISIILRWSLRNW